jgi:hypothetical protein
MFAYNKQLTQDVMLETGRAPSELGTLAAEGQVHNLYLQMALEKPPKKED